MGATGITIEAYDGPTAPEATLRAAYALLEAEDAELHQVEPPFVWEVFEGFQRAVNPSERRLHWLATSADGCPVGAAHAMLPIAGTNEHLAFVHIYVLPAERRHGLGRALLGTVTDAITAEGRTRIRAQVVEGSDGDAFIAARRGTIGRTNRKSRALLDDVDRSMLEGWVKRAEAEATGYSLLAFEERCPEEWLEEYMRVKETMNTAPKGDLDVEDWRYSPEQVRASEAELAAAGCHRLSKLVRHDASGTFVGFTEVVVVDAYPGHGWQGGTAVRPQHRNHGIGRWLKGAMALHLLDLAPPVNAVYTENAFTNKAMLDINDAMGFELYETVNDWELPL